MPVNMMFGDVQGMLEILSCKHRVSTSTTALAHSFPSATFTCRSWLKSLTPQGCSNERTIVPSFTRREGTARENHVDRSNFVVGDLVFEEVVKSKTGHIELEVITCVNHKRRLTRPLTACLHLHHCHPRDRSKRWFSNSGGIVPSSRTALRSISACHEMPLPDIRVSLSFAVQISTLHVALETLRIGPMFLFMTFGKRRQTDTDLHGRFCVTSFGRDQNSNTSCCSFDVMKYFLRLRFLPPCRASGSLQDAGSRPSTRDLDRLDVGNLCTDHAAYMTLEHTGANRIVTVVPM